MFTVSTSGPAEREIRAHHSVSGELVAVLVRLKDGTFYQCFPADLRGAVYPSEDVWRAALRDQLTRGRQWRWRVLQQTFDPVGAALMAVTERVKEKKAVEAEAAAVAAARISLEQLKDLWKLQDQVRAQGEKLAWRAHRAKKDLQRALDAVRDPLEKTLEEE
jgi:hypothetical protein